MGEKIKFKLSGEFKAKVIIYDVLGNEVVPNIDTCFRNSEYEIDITSFNLPQGTYFYKIIASGQSSIKKFTIGN